MATSTQKHPGGRPLKFKTVEELQQKIDEYFNYCNPHPVQLVRYEYPQKTIVDKLGKETEVDDTSKKPDSIVYWGISRQQPYLITGLANFLETSRETLINYENRDEFFDTIKAAKDKCEEFMEQNLLVSNATGPIFNLKNNYGWKDKSETDLTTNGKDLPTPILGGLSRTEINEKTG